MTSTSLNSRPFCTYIAFVCSFDVEIKYIMFDKQLFLFLTLSEKVLSSRFVSVTLRSYLNFPKLPNRALLQVDSITEMLSILLHPFGD